MAFRHYALTLSGTGTPVRLSDVFGDGTGVVNAANNIPLREIVFCADPANAAAVYVGGDNQTVTTTAHAFSLDPTQASQLPLRLGAYASGPLHLSDFYAIGSSNERLMIGVVPF